MQQEIRPEERVLPSPSIGINIFKAFRVFLISLTSIWKNIKHRTLHLSGAEAELSSVR